MRFLTVVSKKDFSGASFDGILISNKTLVISTNFMHFYAKNMCKQQITKLIVA
jgi:hypothetical protein